MLTAPVIGTTSYTWDLWDDQTMPFTEMSDDSDPADGCGGYEYEIIDTSVKTFSTLGLIEDPPLRITA